MNQTEELKLHKKNVIEKIKNKLNKPSFYPLEKMIRTLSCEDTDYIPKVTNAGTIINDESGSYQLMHNGIKVIPYAYNGEWMSDVILGFQGHHEPQEEKVFYEVIKTMPSKATMIELGCNWAFYSLWFAKEIENPTNYLIEPGKKNLELGIKNFQLNNMKGIFAQGFIGQPTNDDDCTNAQRIGIDQFLQINEIEHVNILHSDIQGFEYEMLLSSEQSINAKKIDYFLISTHGDDVHKPCLEFLVSHDYQIIAEHSMAEGYMPDGFIGAKRKDVIGPEKIQISKLAENCRIW